MSRSKKRTPVNGHTTAPSEKEDKVSAHRRVRHHVGMVLRKDPDAETLPHEKELSSPWLMAKDGKQRFDPDEFPEEMRK